MSITWFYLIISYFPSNFQKSCIFLTFLVLVCWNFVYFLPFYARQSGKRIVSGQFTTNKTSYLKPTIASKEKQLKTIKAHFSQLWLFCNRIYLAHKISCGADGLINVSKQKCCANNQGCEKWALVLDSKFEFKKFTMYVMVISLTEKWDV